MQKYLLMPVVVTGILLGSQVTPALADTTPTPAAITSVTIEHGDTLWSIAQTNHVPVPMLESANPSVNPGDLQIGEVIQVPKTWIVVAGDSLFKISHAVGVSAQSIAELNNIVNEDVIQPGKVLLIPEQTVSNTVSVYQRWTVHAGDTLWNIAQITGASVAQIAALNGIKNNELLTDTVILIPPTGKQWTQPPVQPKYVVNVLGGSWYNLEAVANATETVGFQIEDIGYNPLPGESVSLTSDNPSIVKVLPYMSMQNGQSVPDTTTDLISDWQAVLQSQGVAGTAHLTLSFGGQAIRTFTVQVVNPVANIEITMPVTSLVENSSQDYDVNVTALDKTGNPVSNVPLNVVGSPWANENQIVTDAHGNAQFTIQAGNQPGNLSVGVQDPASNKSGYVNYTVSTGN